MDAAECDEVSQEIHQAEMSMYQLQYIYIYTYNNIYICIIFIDFGLWVCSVIWIYKKVIYQMTKHTMIIYIYIYTHYIHLGASEHGVYDQQKKTI